MTAFLTRPVLCLFSLLGMAAADPGNPNDHGTSIQPIGTNTIPANDAKVIGGLSPLNWIRTPGAIHSSVCGASFRLAFMKTRRVVLNLDTSRLKLSSPDRFPILAWSVNKGPIQTHQIATDENSLTLSESVANPIIELHIKGMSPFEDRFNGDVPANAVTLTGFTLDPGGNIVAPPDEPLWLNIGDSILSGDAAAYTVNQGRPAEDRWAASDDARASYGYLLAKHFGYRESRLAFGGYAWSGGLGNNPPVAELVDQITSTTSRLSEGKLQPCPEVILINLGENGAPMAETVIAALGKLRQRTSTDTRILVMVPVSGRARAEVASAVRTYLDSSKDLQTHLVDLGPIKFETADGQHPTAGGHQSIYEATVPQFERILGKPIH